ncbi:hypothetical protein BDF22DRAFT_778021 [Syncephalis plumigaleata]|nr:hypothetical protein BDF22DRAFT_778021 [Syncephalis plumigaleata]
MKRLSMFIAISIVTTLLIRLTSAHVTLRLHNETYTYPTQDPFLVKVPSYNASGSVVVPLFKSDTTCELEYPTPDDLLITTSKIVLLIVEYDALLAHCYSVARYQDLNPTKIEGTPPINMALVEGINIAKALNDRTDVEVIATVEQGMNFKSKLAKCNANQSTAQTLALIARVCAVCVFGYLLVLFSNAMGVGIRNETYTFHTQDPYWAVVQPYKTTGRLVIGDFATADNDDDHAVPCQLKYPNITASNTTNDKIVLLIHEINAIDANCISIQRIGEAAYNLNRQLRSNGHPTVDVVLYSLFTREDNKFPSPLEIDYVDFHAGSMEGNCQLTWHSLK